MAKKIPPAQQEALRAEVHDALAHYHLSASRHPWYAQWHTLHLSHAAEHQLAASRLRQMARDRARARR